MDPIQRIGDVLYGLGEAMQGTSMTDEEALAYALNAFADSTFCLVRDWIWLDLDIPDRLQGELQLAGVKPVVMFAHNIVYDSARRWGESGAFVRSTALRSFSEGFVFQTRNTNYLLLGDGVRKRTDLKTLGLLI
ncbi:MULTISPECIES: DUF6957 family protein [Pseudomonas]|nr:MULTISPECIES: hypothetical protein [Pseudomonas]